MKENNWSSTRVIPHGGHQISCNIAAGLNLGGNERLGKQKLDLVVL